MKPRRHARIIALQALFEVDCVGHELQQVLQHRFEDEELPEEGQAFARNLVQGVMDHLAELDQEITRHATERPLEQAAIVDRNIMRLAAYEILIARETPLKVVINEAVELAKTFGSDSSPRFVNGVLGSLATHVEAAGA
ncbi:MAG: transcription antitermination factor NusB, partial [Chloroflexi bacterium]|nr:transcription antitermination factor NusB [Chloroflexota bacterium]